MEGPAMKILHPTDFSDTADQAQEAAIRLAEGLGGEVILLHVTVETPLYGEGFMNRKEVREVYEATRKWVASELGSPRDGTSAAAPVRAVRREDGRAPRRDRQVRCRGRS